MASCKFVYQTGDECPGVAICNANYCKSHIHYESWWVDTDKKDRDEKQRDEKQRGKKRRDKKQNIKKPTFNEEEFPALGTPKTGNVASVWLQKAEMNLRKGAFGKEQYARVLDALKKIQLTLEELSVETLHTAYERTGDHETCGLLWLYLHGDYTTM